MNKSIIGILYIASIPRVNIIRIAKAVSSLILVLQISSCSGKNKLPPELTIEIHPTVYPFTDTDRNNQSNPYRYIAHAGGEYGGMTYTNSLEAMDLSMTKGFKVFELDLIITRDNQIAAAHDWTHWRAITGYAGNTPPTLSEFISLPLYDNLTPLSMTDITAWFGAHTDAILVTDKITDYEKIATEFPYPERIMVEVFTLNDYIRAYRAGIRYPLLSLEAAASGPNGEWLFDFIIDNEVPMAVLSTVSTEIFRDEISAINRNGGCVFAFTSNEVDYLPAHHDLFGVYTDTINFTTMTIGTISKAAPRFND